MGEKIKDIFYVTLITSILTFASAFFLLEFEMEHNDQVNNFFDAFWLTVVTLTSLGYGDVVPVTLPGKIIAIFLMFFSIVLIGAIAAIVSHDFIGKRRLVKKEIKKVEL